MSENVKPSCPECDAPEQSLDTFNRRHFIRVVGGSTAGLALAGVSGVPALLADNKQTQAEAKPAKKPEKPAESLIKELFAGLSAEQKKSVNLDWDHGSGQGKTPTRLKMYNASLNAATIGKTYTKAQQELVLSILRAISSDEAGFQQLTRNDTFDASGSLQNCGSHIFGNPNDGKFAWVFSGHHLTVRCDGNSVEGAAFGGPMYYGHTPDGYSARNCFNYQTKSVLSVYAALSEKQRKVAVVSGSPGEQEASVKLKGADAKKPGISYGELSKDQQELVATVMRTVLSPYRKEDADEVMQIIKTNGGMEKIHLAFYQDAKPQDAEKWHFWRLEGPGFVWNYRVLPHVHTFVNISSKF